MQLFIRNANREDIESLMKLSIELGYHPVRIEIENKLEKFDSSLIETILVAEYEQVVGWIHISLVEPLESNSFVEIRGLVVNKKYRKRGIGTELIKSAEKWARENGCEKIRVRTNIKREETREYYNNLNFKSIKTQEVFEKKI